MIIVWLILNIMYRYFIVLIDFLEVTMNNCVVGWGFRLKKLLNIKLIISVVYWSGPYKDYLCSLLSIYSIHLCSPLTIYIFIHLRSLLSIHLYVYVLYYLYMYTPIFSTI